MLTLVHRIYILSLISFSTTRNNCCCCILWTISSAIRRTFVQYFTRFQLTAQLARSLSDISWASCLHQWSYMEEGLSQENCLRLVLWQRCVFCTRSRAVAEGPRERAVSWNLENTAQMFDGLHLKRPTTGEWPSRSFKGTNTGAIR